MIKDEEMRRQGPEEEMIRLAQQGKIETILSHKESIDLRNLFSPSQPLVVLPPPPPPGRVCLIEGAPGGGKSTLALHICHQWAQGASWLARFDIVVLAYLREEGIQNATNLADILPTRSLDMSERISTLLQATDGNNVLFVFDGWDEFSSSLMNKSLVSTIIRQPHKLSLHRSTVLITTRPVASGNLLNIADRRVEILGFTRHQIREYIEKALNGNSTNIQKLVQHLEAHPVIEGYCYIPLHSAILVHIFLTMKKALPTTHHELFCDLVLCCIVREYDTHEPDTILPELSSLDDLPDDLKAKLKDHCKLAYDGVMHDKVVFNSKDLQVSHLPAALSSLGLLQAVEGLTLTSRSCSYNFLHLSVQELLAAYSISQIDPSEQVEVFMKLFHESSRFQAVLCYYSGFTKLVNPEIQEFISCMHFKPSLKELLPLLHCFFEAQQPSLCLLVNSKFATDGIELDFAVTRNPSDCLVIGHFMTSLLSTSAPDMSPLCLRIECKYTDNLHCLKLLLSELSKYPVTASALSRKIVISLGTEEKPVNYNWLVNDVDDDDDFPSFTGQGVKIMASYLKMSTIVSEIVLYNGEIQRDEDGLFYIAEALQTNTSLTRISLLQVYPQHTEKNGPVLIRMLQMNKSLKCLDLQLNFLDSEILCCLFKGVRDNTTLTHLILQKSLGIALWNSDPDLAKSLSEMLQENKTLTHLDLSGNNVFRYRKLVCCIFNGLQHNTALTHLFLSDNCKYESCDLDAAQSLNLMLRVNKTLTHLDLSGGTNFSFSAESKACYIFEGLQHNTTLVSLNLSSIDITANNPDTAKSLTKMLQVNKSLTHLDLSSNKKFSDPGARCIFKGLEHNTSLTYLNLSNTGITATDPETGMSLTKMLQENKSLTHLDLSENHTIGHKNLIILCTFQGLEHNATLLELDVSHMPMVERDAECIAQALRCNLCLQTLNLYYSCYSDRFTRPILESLKINTSLKLLYLVELGETRRIAEDVIIARESNGLPTIDIILVEPTVQ